MKIVSSSNPLTGGESKQTQRIKRFYMSAMFFLLCIIPVGLSVYLNLLPLTVMLIWLGICVIGHSIMYLMFRSGMNERLKDPSLTIPHMVFSIALVLYLHTHAGPTRGGYLLALMLIFAFGCFKLQARQLIWMSVITIAGYICTLPIIISVEESSFNPAAELVVWTAFIVFVPSLAILTNSFNALRRQLTEANRKLIEINSLDGLTGVKNRSCFDAQLEYNLRRSERSLNAISLLMIDVDHFKGINDEYGHLGGDICLKQLAKIIKQSARRITDETFRFGGEEFAVLLAATDSSDAIIIAETIRQKVEKSSVSFNGHEIFVTVSIGSASIVPKSDTRIKSELLVEQADKALYQAKKSGRNKVCSSANQILSN